MRWRSLSPVLGCGLLFVTAACSGVNPDNLLDDAGIAAPDASSPPVDDAAAPDGGTPPDATIADASTEDVTHPADAAPDVHVGPADSTIDCGPTLKCSAQNELCCHHGGTTTNPYECVSSPASCAGIDDVPIACSTQANCTSQGNPTYVCCATANGWGSGQCYNYDIATSVACKSDCTGATDYEIGCSVQQQNCSDSLQTCVVSKCTLPGYTMCY
ncbi:MAG TPA: hypothetical protein VLM85_17995 [Polyangiaceae bacterium]|nr:hypothetical protein [Polyangiaceae bacterium]